MSRSVGRRVAARRPDGRRLAVLVAVLCRRARGPVAGVAVLVTVLCRRARGPVAGVAVLVAVLAAGSAGSAGTAHAAPAARSAVPAARSAVAAARSAVPASLSPGEAGSPPLTLVGQTPWVASGGLLTLQLVPTHPLPAGDVIAVTGYSRLFTRTGFDAAAAGKLGGEYAIYPVRQAVASAPRRHGGGYLVRIPVNAASTGSDLPTFNAAAGSGVYPLQVQLLRSDGVTTVGAPITTFLVYDGGTDGFPRLSVSLTVPVTAATTLSPGLLPGPVSGTDSAALASLTSVLAANPSTPVSLQVTPQTVEALRAGTATDRSTAARLATLVAGHDQLLPAPYVQVPLASLGDSGLDQQLSDQLQVGSASLARTLGVTPDPGAWDFTDPVDAGTVQYLEPGGLRRIVVPARALTPLPSALLNTTYARPTRFADGAGTRGMEVVGTDATLTARATDRSTPVLAAEQTLAEMAMIQLEQPSLVRGVAVTLPAGSALAPAYLSTLLAGLQRNPFLDPVTVNGLFARVPLRSGASSGTATAAPAPAPAQSLVPVAAPGVADAGRIAELTAQTGGVVSMYPEETALAGRIREQLLVAPSTGLSESSRQALLVSLAGDVRSAQSRVRLPAASSVTLTSLKSTLPMTITSDPRLAAHVQLVLESPKLEFLDWRPSGGSCSVVGRTTEICGLVLRGPETTFKIPVESRTSGVFTLDVHLLSADGSLPLADARDTVRSTAVSFVGLVIIVLALGFLAIWWLRDIRSGRRARQLVRLPAEADDTDEDGGDGGDGPPGGSEDPQPPPPADPPAPPARPEWMPPRPVPARSPLAPVGAERRRSTPGGALPGARPLGLERRQGTPGGQRPGGHRPGGAADVTI